MIPRSTNNQGWMLSQMCTISGKDDNSLRTKYTEDRTQQKYCFCPSQQNKHLRVEYNSSQSDSFALLSHWAPLVRAKCQIARNSTHPAEQLGPLLRCGQFLFTVPLQIYNFRSCREVQTDNAVPAAPPPGGMPVFAACKSDDLFLRVGVRLGQIGHDHCSVKSFHKFVILANPVYKHHSNHRQLKTRD